MTTMRTADLPAPAKEAEPLAAKDILAASARGGSNPPPPSGLDDRLLPVVRSALDGFAAGVHDAVLAEIRRRADEMLSAPVVDRLVAAWRDYTALVEAARATVAAPGTTKLVDLGDLETTSTNTWTVDIVVWVPVVSIDFTLTVVFRLHAAVATVCGGRIIRIGDGRCDVRVTFTAMQQQLAEHSEEIDLYDHLSFTPGILLV